MASSIKENLITAFVSIAVACIGSPIIYWFVFPAKIPVICKTTVEIAKDSQFSRGVGARKVVKEIKFKNIKFDDVPEVFVIVKLLDAKDGEDSETIKLSESEKADDNKVSPGIRYSIEINNVSTDGCEVGIATWGQTKIFDIVYDVYAMPAKVKIINK